MNLSANNPLIEDQPADTLRNVKCVLSFLEAYAAPNNATEQRLSYDDYIGLFCILRCAGHAIAYELPRINQ